MGEWANEVLNYTRADGKKVLSPLRLGLRGHRHSSMASLEARFRSLLPQPQQREHEAYLLRAD